MIYGFDTLRWYAVEMVYVYNKLQQRYKGEVVVKALNVDRGLGFVMENTEFVPI